MSDTKIIPDDAPAPSDLTEDFGSDAAVYAHVRAKVAETLNEDERADGWERAERELQR